MQKAQDNYRFTLLAVDDHPGILASLKLILEDQVDFTGVTSGESAMDLIQTNTYDIVITDYDLKSDINGMTIFREARKRNPLVTACLMTANSSASVMKDVFSAFGGTFIDKPFDDNSFTVVFNQARRNRMQMLEIAPEHDRPSILSGIIAETPSMVKLLESVQTSSKMQSLSIHMTGPTGTGKSMLAELIHKFSGVKGPLVTVNCAGLEELAMSRLFGHAKGAFTGAMKDHEGYVKQADGGTLFLDELPFLSRDVQGKLLRVLQDGKYQRLGETIERTSQFRVITAASVNVRKLAEEGRFLPDLWYRISGKTLTVPALSERKACIPRLVYQQLRNVSNETGRTYELDNDAMDLFVSFSWDGNIRDLSNSIRSICSETNSTGRITSTMVRDDLHKRAGRFSDTPIIHMKGENLSEACRSFEISLIEKALKNHQNNISHAARALGVPRTTLRSRLDKLGLHI